MKKINQMVFSKKHKQFVKSKRTLILAVISLMLISLSCGRGNTNNSEAISDKIVLKIGKAEITEFEFRNLVNRLPSINPNEKVSSKIQRVIREIFFLADALEQGYDMQDNARLAVLYSSRNMISKLNGYVWNKVEKPKLEVSKHELNEALEKSTTSFYIEYVCVKDQQILRKVLDNQSFVPTQENFRDLVKSCEDEEYANYQTQPIIWPFGDLGAVNSQIYHMSIGEISNPLETPHGIYIVHVLRKEEVSLGNSDSFEQQLIWNLEAVKEDVIIWNKQKEIYAKADIQINYELIVEIAELFKMEMTTDLDQLGESVLISYRHNDTICNISVDDFRQRLKYDPFCSTKPAQRESVIQHLKHNVIEDYICDLADEVGIYDDLKYQLDKESFTHNMVKSNYFISHYKEIEISDKESIDYYERNKTDFIEGQIATVSFLKYDSKEAAYANQGLLNDIIMRNELYRISDTNEMKGLVKYEPNQKLDFSDNELEYKTLIQIFKTPENLIGPPIEVEGVHTLFLVTKKEGKRIKEFAEVENEVRKTLKENRFEQLKDSIYTSLQHQYQIEIDLTRELKFK